MKKYLMMACALLFAACAKEAPVQQEEPVQENRQEAAPELVTYSFNASILATKAYIDENDVTDGVAALKWSSGDEIALYDTVSEDYVVFSTTDAGANATFTAEAPAGASFSKAYYPADYRGGSLVDYYNAAFASDKSSLMSLTDARKSFVMEVASIEANASSITFSQKGSLVKFTVNNVPDFAAKASFSFGDLSETVAIASSDIVDGTAVFYFPVPSGSHDMTFSLIDNASTPNTFYTKTRSSAKLGLNDKNEETATLHRFTVTLGHVLRVEDEVDWTTRELYLWNGENNRIFTLSGDAPYKLHTTGAHNHYILIPKELSSWTGPTNKVGVKFQDKDAVHSTETEGVYINRDITFNVPSGGGMKTEYRIYPRSSTRTSMNVFVTRPLKLYVYNKANWENAQIYRWSRKNGSDVVPTAWDDVPWTKINDGSTSFNSKTCKELSLEASLCGGTAGSSGIIIGNLGGVKSGDLNTQFIGDVYVEFDGASSSITDFNNTTKRLSAAWPGTAFTGISSTINAGKYYSFADDYYGAEVWVVFSDNGSNQSGTWTFTVNQDYDYGF